MTVPTEGRRAVFTQALEKAEADKADAERRITVFKRALADLEGDAT